MREAEGVTVSLEQSKKKEQALEEEGRRLAEELADTLRLVKELQGELRINSMLFFFDACQYLYCLYL